MIKPIQRRAVGGLISLIGIMVVFGIVSVAYLELSSAQTNLINTSLISNQKISDKNNARLNFTDISVDGNAYDITIDNMDSDSITIHSYIIERDNRVTDKGEIDSVINAGNTNTISVSSTDPNLSSDTLLIISSTGKKCSIPADVSYRIC